MINQFNIEYPIWTLLLPIAVGVLYALLLYFKNRKNKLSAPWTVLLFVLRFSSTALIALLLLAPFIKTTKKHIQKPRLIVAVDNSKSMIYSSDSTFLTKNLTSDLTELEDALSNKYEIDRLLFGKSVKPLDSVNFNEDGSDYSKLFAYVNEHYQTNEIEAMILVGDGIFNRGTDPVYASSNISFPVFSVVVGDTVKKPDLKINDISYNSLVYLNENMPIEVNFTANGLKNQAMTINIFMGRDLQKSRKITIDKNELNKTERFDLKANTPGKHRLRIELQIDTEEANKANNYKSVFTDVLDARQKILILANSPHPDVSALRQAISGFKNYEVDIAYPGDKNITLNTYSLVVLHQLPSIKYSIPNILSEINKQKMPVLAIIGEQTKLNAAFRFFGKTGYNSAMRSFENSMATFNQNFPLFNIDDIDITLMETLPPLKTPLGNYKNVDPSNVLAWQQINSIKTNFPLIYFTEQEERKSCIVLGEGLWLWRNYNFLEKSNFNSFDNLIGKTVQYLMAKADKRYFRIKNKGEFNSTDKIELQAELYNKSYEPIKGAEIGLKVTNEKGETFDYVFNSLGNSYKLELNKRTPGVYKYVAKTTYNNEAFTEKGEFVIVKRNLEAQQLKANYNLLFKIAERNNGGMFQLENIMTIKEALNENEVKSRISYSQTYSGLNNIPLILVFIILLLTAEWVLRKYLGSY